MILGPFSTDREQARRSFRRLAGLDAEVVCFGHGRPLISAGVATRREAVAADTVPDSLG